MPAIRTVTALLRLAWLWPALALGQINLQFQEGSAGQVPPGWFVLDAVKDAGYTALWRREGCRNDAACAVLTAPASPPPESFGNLMQSFDATAFRGKTVRLRAWIRLDAMAPADHAQMLLHVGRVNSQAGFVDNMADRPIVSAEWKNYEIRGEVAPDAESIRIGLMLYGKGRAWVCGVEFDAVTDETAGPAVTAARDAIQKQYDRIDSAFVRGAAGEIAAVVMPDAQIGVGTIREPLLPAIQGEIKNGSKLAARTVVGAVRLVGDEGIATVTRDAKDPASDGRRVITTHRDTWVRTPAGWRWQESIEVSYHWILPPTEPAAARPVVAELKARAVPVDDLAPFGRAVGDARMVALGGDSRGTREFFQLKQRLLEYLVKVKGFTVLAVAGNGPAATDIDPAVRFARLDAASEVVRLAEVVYPNAKIVLWASNGDVRAAWLRERFGRKVWVAGFTFHRGAVRAVGVEAGASRGLNVWPVPASPEGSGDAVLSGAGLPLFFLDMAGLPAGGVLARWLAEAHLFHDLGAYWVLDDPDASLQPEELRRFYDGVFFVEEGHAGEG